MPKSHIMRSELPSYAIIPSISEFPTAPAQLVHGEEEAVKAREASKALFTTGSAANMPTETITDDIFTDGNIDILQLLISANLATSRNEARRAVEQGGVSVNGEKVTDTHASYTKDDFAEEFILKKGKKKFCKVTLA